MGCSDADIAELEEKVGLRLPGVVRAYLARMGRRPGRFVIGSDIGYGCLHLLTGEGREMMHDMGICLPPDAFVVLAHQGYDYLYVRTEEGDDPVVYRVHEVRGGPRPVFHRFTEYVAWMFAGGSVPPRSLEDGI